MKALSKLVFVGYVILPMSAGYAMAETVKMSLEDNAIKVDHDGVKQGKITFEVVNDSITEEHEMVVIAKPAGEIPYGAKTKRVVEKKVRSFGEVADL